MGDRTTVYFRMGGTVSQEQASEIVAALLNERMLSNESWSRDLGSAQEEPCLENLGDTFYAHEVNYANIDDLLSAMPDGVAWEYWWDAGGGYGPGVRRCLDGRNQERSAIEGEAVFTLTEVGQTTSLDDFKAEIEWWSKPLPDLVILDGEV